MQRPPSNKYHNVNKHPAQGSVPWLYGIHNPVIKYHLSTKIDFLLSQVRPLFTGFWRKYTPYVNIYNKWTVSCDYQQCVDIDIKEVNRDLFPNIIETLLIYYGFEIGLWTVSILLFNVSQHNNYVQWLEKATCK